MEVEIEFFHENITNKDSKLLIDYLQSVGSGEIPFFSATLSLVYDGLFDKAFPKPSPFNPGPGQVPGGQGAITPTPTQASNSTSNATSSSISNTTPSVAPTVATSSTTSTIAGTSNLAITRPSATTTVSPSVQGPPAPTRTTVPSSTPINRRQLKCTRCNRYANMEQLQDGLHCPWCPATGRNGLGLKGRPYMRCYECNFLRTTNVGQCPKGHQHA